MKLIQAFFLPKSLTTDEHGSEIANIAKIADIAKIVRTDRLKPQQE